MKRVIFLLLNQLLLTSCEPGNFVENAGEWMEAGYKTWVRLGEEVEDVTVIEVRKKNTKKPKKTTTKQTHKI